MQGWKGLPLISQILRFQQPSSPLCTITFAGQYNREGGDTNLYSQFVLIFFQNLQTHILFRAQIAPKHTVNTAERLWMNLTLPEEPKRISVNFYCWCSLQKILKISQFISHVKILQAGGILVEDTTDVVVVVHSIGLAPPPHRSCFLTEAEC